MVPVAATDAGAPPGPKGATVGMNTPPVVHAANLVSPTVVDVGHATPIDVRPCGPIVDDVVPADIDLANIDVSIAHRRPISNSVSDPIAISDSRAVANPVAWSQWLIHP